MKYSKLIILITTILLTGCGVQNVIEGSKTESIENTSLRQLGDDAYDDQIWDDVVKYYTKLVKTSSDDSKLWYRIGNAYNQLGQTNFAINSYQAALALDEYNTKILHNLAVIQLRESIKTFLKLEKYTNHNDPLNIRAQLVINTITTLLHEEFRTQINN